MLKGVTREKVKRHATSLISLLTVAGRDMNNFDSKISETSEIPLRHAKRKAAMESERRNRQIVNWIYFLVRIFSVY